MASLALLSVYKTWLGITSSTYDTALQLVLDSASAEIRRWCGRDETTGFSSATRTEYYDGNDEITIQLREFPITSITSVTIRYADGTTEALDSTTYRANTITGLLARIDASRGRFVSMRSDLQVSMGTFLPEPRFPQGFANITVVYVGGYSTIPSDLQMACMRMSDIMWSARGRDPTLTSEKIGDYSYTRDAADAVAAIKTNLMQAYRTAGA